MRIIAGTSLQGSNDNSISKSIGSNAVNSSSSISSSSIAQGIGRARGNSISEVSKAISKTRVLVCAPSNTAVDELVYRLVTQVQTID